LYFIIAQSRLRLLPGADPNRWREEAEKAGHRIERIAIAFEAGSDGFWLARWLRARDIEAHVIHASSVAVSREHRRAKTDRLDTELLKRAFLGWLLGGLNHCKMVAIPTLAQEDAKRPNRERESLVTLRPRLSRFRVVGRWTGDAASRRAGIPIASGKLRRSVNCRRGHETFAYVTIASAVTMLILFAIAAGIRHQLRLDRIRDDLHSSSKSPRSCRGSQRLGLRVIVIVSRSAAKGCSEQCCRKLTS
jgi:hypothetical protein